MTRTDLDLAGLAGRPAVVHLADEDALAEAARDVEAEADDVLALERDADHLRVLQWRQQQQQQCRHAQRA